MNKLPSPIDVLYVHPSGNLNDFNIPMGLIGLMNSIDCRKIGRMYFELTEDEIASARIILMDCHWYFSLSEIGRLARRFKKINPEGIVVVGGYTATLFAENIVKFFEVDYVIKGDAEKPFLLLIKALLGDGDIRGIPNITHRDFCTEQSYFLTREDYNRVNCITIDWFPALKTRMRLFHGRLPFHWNEEIGLYPFIPVFKGCFHDCRFCYGGRTLQAMLCKRGMVTRSPESIVRDLSFAVKKGDIKQVFMIADFVQILGEKFSHKIFSHQYDLNIQYEFDIQDTVTPDMLDKMIGAFKKINFRFIYSEYFHKESEKETYAHLAKILRHLKKYKKRVGVELYSLKGNKSFEASYAKLSRIYRGLVLVDHQSWLDDVPQPSDPQDEAYFRFWIKKSREKSREHFIAKSQKQSDARFHLLAAEALFRFKKYSKALLDAHKAIELGDKNPNTLFLLGICYQRLRAYPKAIEMLKKAEKRLPREDAVNLSLCACYKRIGKAKEAGLEMDKGLRNAIRKKKEREKTNVSVERPADRGSKGSLAFSVAGKFRD